VASFGAGATAREMINANARSRIRPAGPSNAGSPSFCAMAHTAATWPCGTDRLMLATDAASTRSLPASTDRTAVIAAAGRCERFATVSLRTFPSSRKERRNRWVS